MLNLTCNGYAYTLADNYFNANFIRSCAFNHIEFKFVNIAHANSIRLFTPIGIKPVKHN